MSDTLEICKIWQTTRPELFTLEQAARAHDLAARALSEIGLEVRHAPSLERLQRQGLRAAGQRVLFERGMIEEYVDEMRQRLIAERAAAPVPADEGRIRLRISTYPLNIHDLEQDRLVPYTTERLIEMTKFLDSLADDRVEGAPPGIPQDVAPAMQPLAQYRIAALYARQGAAPVDPTAAATALPVLDMAEAMGRPIRGLPVYVVSPLRLGGESFETVLACRDRLQTVRVGSMPALGANAPLQPFGALALALAELIGGMIVMRLLTGLPTTFHLGVFPFDLRVGAMVFGSPENVQLQMMAADCYRFYGGPEGAAPDNLHMMAKRPDAQAGADKAACLMTGAMLGARRFSGAGALSLDDAFSAEQLLLDCEMRDWAERFIQRMEPGEAALGDWLAELRAGLERGYIERDATLDHHQEYTWYPRFFSRSAIAPWLEAGQPHLRDAMCADVRRRIAAHRYELDESRRRDIERIYRQAERHHLDGAHASQRLALH